MWLKLILLTILVFMVSCQVQYELQDHNQTEIRKVVVYKSTTNLVSGSPFEVILSNSFTSIPKIIYGISDYQMADQFFYENFQCYITNITLTNFQIKINVVSSTSIRRFGISYMAVYLSDLYLRTINTTMTSSQLGSVAGGSGFRQSMNSFSVASLNITSFSVSSNIVGLFISSSIGFNISIKSFIINSTTYNVSVATSSTSNFTRVNLWVMLIDIQSLKQVYKYNYYQYGQIEVISNNLVIINNTNSNRLWLGISRIISSTSNISANYSWSIFNSTISINNSFQFMYFVYGVVAKKKCPLLYPYWANSSIQKCVQICQIGQYADSSSICNSCGNLTSNGLTCTPVVTPVTPASPSSSSPILIIVVVIIVLVGLGISIGCLIYFKRKKQTHQIISQPHSMIIDQVQFPSMDL